MNIHDKSNARGNELNYKENELVDIFMIETASIFHTFANK